MNLQQIKKLIAKGESETLEFKTSTAQLKPACEALCGFLNAKGGIVLIGVGNKGQLTGQQVTDNTHQEIANELRKFEPSVQIEVDYVKIDGKQVIIMKAPAGKHIPYTYDGRPYERTLSSKGRMTQHHYEQLLIQRGQLNHSWEDYPAEGYDIGSLDQDEIYRTIAEGVHVNRIPGTAIKENATQILKRLKLSQNNKLKNAAIVLFAKAECLDLPQCMIKMARFKGTDKLGEFLDNQRVDGNAFKVLEAADDFLRRHLPIASFFNPNQFQRIDKPALPVIAVREAIINAICHRDYSMRSGSISLAIFDTHVEIWNNGSLPASLKIEDLKHSHESIPRNELIAKVFHDRGLIETWGTGTNKMIEECQRADIPEPEFRERSGGIVVIFRFKEPIGTSKSDKNKAIQMSARQKIILALIQKHGSMNIHQIMESLSNSPSQRMVRMDLDFLRKADLLELEGYGRSALWKIRH